MEKSDGENSVRKELPRGLLIAFEGIDGAGKTTQIRMLYEYLTTKGYDVLLLREPTESPWGKQIRMLAQEGRGTPEEELYLFVEDRKVDVQENIQPALQRRQIVLIDRYYFSTMAYQGARGIEVDRIRRINEVFAPHPDLIFILSLSPNQAIARLLQERGKQDLFERKEYLAKVAKIFSSFREERICRIDAGQSIEEVQATIRARVIALIKSLSASPAGKSIDQ